MPGIAGTADKESSGRRRVKRTAFEPVLTVGHALARRRLRPSATSRAAIRQVRPTSTGASVGRAWRGAPPPPNSVHTADLEGLSLFHEGGEGLRVIRMPAREGWPVLDDVASGPENATLIEWSGCIVVWTQDVKIPDGQPLDHEIDGLFWCPCTRRLLGAAFGGQL